MFKQVVPRVNSFIQKVFLMVLIFRIPTMIIVNLLKRKRLNNIQWLSSYTKRIIDRRNKYVFNCYKDMSISYIHEKKRIQLYLSISGTVALSGLSLWCYFFFPQDLSHDLILYYEFSNEDDLPYKSNNLYLCAGFLVLFFITINFLSFITYWMFWILVKLNVF